MTQCLTQALADFVSQTRYEDLPKEVVEYTKLLIADTLICGIAAGNLERTRMMHRVLDTMGGQEDATVFGHTRRFPAALAAMANSEVMNALDADDTFFTTSHFAAFNVAGALAEAERQGASGQDLILAVALGFDINARLNLSSVVIGEDERGELEWSPVQGMGFATFGTAVGSAVVRGLSREQMRNMFGIAGQMAPTPTVNKTVNLRIHNSMKYANYAGVGFAGMMSSELAAQGYIGDQQVLDEGAFFRAQGCLQADGELLLEELGQKWWVLETCFKYYPSCRYTHGPIDILRTLMQEEDFTAADIERIVIHMNPMGYALRFFREPAQEIAPDHLAPLNGAFNIPYVMALAALGRTPGPEWYSDASLQDPEVWALARKITTAANEQTEDTVRAAFKTRIRRFRKTPASLTVVANGREYFRSTEYVDGDPWSPETKTKWPDIEQKGRNFLSGMWADERIERLLSAFRRMEQWEDVRKEFVG